MTKLEELKAARDAVDAARDDALAAVYAAYAADVDAAYAAYYEELKRIQEEETE